ncbi:MAG: methyltransferase domain-containing protein [Candidatus Pacebacteria bacterium]|nr:methyltransferase domain-containing protein [Candidatus Paceibacterota bacterium]NUQ57077.1 methyltransferase domain-containing protein [Candidatus Paceibacter sp.]
MERNYAQKYYSADESGWWFLARRDILWRLVKKISLGKKAEILDYGCGGGYVIRSLNRQGYDNVYGLEISEEAVRVCRASGLNKVFLESDEFFKSKIGKFDAIIASDVIEHIQGDRNILAKWKKMLKSGGNVIIFVPAFNFLWDTHDIENQHFRRYTKAGLKNLLEKEDFIVQRISYWNFVLFFPLLALIVAKKALYFLGLSGKKSDYPRLAFLNIHPPRFINGLLSFIIKVENIILDRMGINLPLGISVFAVAKLKK